MGARKKIAAEKRKEALKTQYFAKLQSTWYFEVLFKGCFCRCREVVALCYCKLGTKERT